MILQLNNVTKTFGGLVAVDDVSFGIEKRAISSLIGPNGAGKTTLFNLITGTLPVDSGTIEFNGRDITYMRPYQTCRRGITRTYQAKNLFPNLTVYQNVEAGMLKEYLPDSEMKREVYEILDFLDMVDSANKVVRDLPPLDAKLVELARSLATRSKLLLLDELIGGLIKSETQTICDLIEELNDEGYTIFQVAHEMGPIMQTSDWVVVLDEGSKLAEGTPEEVQNNKEVQDIYLETTSGVE